MSSRAIRVIVAASILMGMAACNGTAVVTVTSTVPQNSFLAYRISLESVALKSTDGGTTVQILPSAVTLDLAKLGAASLVLGAAPAMKGSYGSAQIVLDFGAAQIIADDGSLDGAALTAVGAGGQALGRVQITTRLDPAKPFSITANEAARLALDFSVGASSSVNLAQRTVTLTPLIAASAIAIDGKTVMVRGPVSGVDATNARFVSGIAPFDSAGSGQLAISPGTSTTYEINGAPSTGASGLAQLAALSPGTPVVSYGSFTSGTAATGGAAATLAATQVLAGSSVQGSGFDRVTGVVSARSGSTLTVEDPTLIGNDGTNTLIPGTALIELGPATGVTLAGQGGTVGGNSIGQISVGSNIDAFGATRAGSGSLLLDARAGRVRLLDSHAAGLVIAKGTGALTVNLTSLGGRSAAALDFSGTGTIAAGDAAAGAYTLATGTLDLSNAEVGAPVDVTGMVASFGAAPADFNATALLDPTTLPAELLVDWGVGSTMPFVRLDSAMIDLNAQDPALGPRHLIALGALQTDIRSLSSDPLIVPAAPAQSVFSIGHSASATIENFNAYVDFIGALQKYLNGATVVTGMTAEGSYAVSSHTLTATAITVQLSD